MANISSARGFCILEGNWSEEAVEALIPVAECWEFQGAYGLTLSSRFSSSTRIFRFMGSGRWSFNGTLSNLNGWLLKAIRDGSCSNGLTLEQYSHLLTLMDRDGLDLVFTYLDQGELHEFPVLEEDRVFSDGTELICETASCEDVDESCDIEELYHSALPKYITEPTAEAICFRKKNFVLTGTFTHDRNDRDRIEARITEEGGRCSSAVSGKTNFLVLGDGGGWGDSKLTSARGFQAKGGDIRIVYEADLYRYLEQ